MTQERAPKLRIAHLVAPARAGGLETIVRSLMRLAPGAGVDARLIVLDQLSGAHPFVADARQDGLDVLTIPSGGRRYFAEASAVADLLRSLDIQLLHTHGYHADVVGFLAARRTGTPLVSTAHGVTGGNWKNRMFETLQHLAFRRFGRVIAVSSALADRLAASGVPRQKLAVVRNAIAPARGLERDVARRALGVDARSFRLGWVGRLSQEKGPDVMLEALALLADQPVTLSFLGDGPMRAALESQAASLGIADRISWHGMLPGAAGHLKAFDALVLSSRTEGTPMVLLEAMAAGVPVIATSVGGIPDVVSSGEALLVPSLRPDLLGAAIRDVMTDGAAAMARAARASARLEREFSAAPWMARHTELYRDVMGARA